MGRRLVLGMKLIEGLSYAPTEGELTTMKCLLSDHELVL
jgi:hypothetical protein